MCVREREREHVMLENSERASWVGVVGRDDDDGSRRGVKEIIEL